MTINRITLILLPGLDGTGLLFEPLLRHLPENIRAMVIDYPRDIASGYDELLPRILQQLPQDQPFVLLGESFGGPLSLRVAATRPPRLAGLILCATFVTCPFHFVPAWSRLLVRPLPFYALPWVAFIKARLEGYADPQLDVLMRNALRSVQPEVFARRIREVITVDVTRELAELAVPVLYLQARHDRVVPGSNLRHIQRIRPDIKVCRIESSHLLLQTRPECAAAEIGRFVAEIA